jgi:hypothetical protein
MPKAPTVSGRFRHKVEQRDMPEAQLRVTTRVMEQMAVVTGASRSSSGAASLDSAGGR